MKTHQLVNPSVPMWASVPSLRDAFYFVLFLNVSKLHSKVSRAEWKKRLSVWFQESLIIGTNFQTANRCQDKRTFNATIMIFLGDSFKSNHPYSSCICKQEQICVSCRVQASNATERCVWSCTKYNFSPILITFYKLNWSKWYKILFFICSSI